MSLRLEPLYAWWQTREPSEKRTLRWGAIVLFPLLLIFGLWLPLDEHVQKLEARVFNARAELTEMRGMQSWIKATNSDATTTRAALPPDLPSRLEDELQRTVPEFGGQVRANAGGIDIQIRTASFDALIPWLARLAREEGLFTVELQLSPGRRTGLVEGRVRLQAEGT